MDTETGSENSQTLSRVHTAGSPILADQKVRDRPVEWQVDPMFEVAPEDVANSLFEAAFDRWFEHVLAAPGEGVRRVLSRRELADREGPRPILQAAAWELVSWRDFDAPWQQESFERERAVDRLVDEVAALGELGAEADPHDWLRRAVDEIRPPISEATPLESGRGRDYRALEDALLRLLRGNGGRWRWRGAGAQFGPLARAEVIAKRHALGTHLHDFPDPPVANLAPL